MEARVAMVQRNIKQGKRKGKLPEHLAKCSTRANGGIIVINDRVKPK